MITQSYQIHYIVLHVGKINTCKKFTIIKLNSGEVDIIGTKEIDISKIEQSIEIAKDSGTKVNYFIFKEF